MEHADNSSTFYDNLGQGVRILVMPYDEPTPDSVLLNLYTGAATLVCSIPREELTAKLQSLLTYVAQIPLL